MLSAFDALVPDTVEDSAEVNESVASVDLTAIINRINDLETKINEILNKITEPQSETAEEPQSETAEEPPPAVVMATVEEE